MRGGIGEVLIAACVMLASGCVSTAMEGVGQGQSAVEDTPRPPVVAIIDSGINPYHVAFSQQASTTAPHVFSPEGSVAVTLSRDGDYDARVGADESYWKSAEAGILYAYNGTRIAAMSFTSRDSAHVLDYDGHGTATASLVARESPSAFIVALQVDIEVCLDGECFVDRSISDALAWAAQQPWIDIISVSLALPANLPDQSAIHPEVEAYLAASKLAADRGKIMVNAAGNEVVPSTLDYFNGPPWVIAVGGAQAERRGEALMASKAVDVVANYTETVARFDSVDATYLSGGTSYAAPIVAGTIAHAIELIRENVQGRGVGPAPQTSLVPDTTVPADRIRAAMNLSATYFLATEWDPQPMSLEPRLVGGTHVPVVIPFVQMGWGYLDGGVAPEIARRVIEADDSMPPDKEVAAEYMAQHHASREAAWE